MTVKQQAMRHVRQGAIRIGLLWLQLSLGGMPVQAQINAPINPPTSSPMARSANPVAFRVMEPVIPNVPPLDHTDRYLPSLETSTYIVLRLNERRVYVYQGETMLAYYPVAIGKPSTPTPTGEFRVFQMITDPIWQSPWTGEVEPPGPDGSLGLRWIGFANLPNGVIGFHGTPNEASIGQAASNGCVRMYNEDVVQLFDQIEMGMLVRVEP